MDVLRTAREEIQWREHNICMVQCIKKKNWTQ